MKRLMGAIIVPTLLASVSPARRRPNFRRSVASRIRLAEARMLCMSDLVVSDLSTDPDMTTLPCAQTIRVCIGPGAART